MKRVIGIFYNIDFNEQSFYTGCGGSETWVIQIAKEFQNRGYHVMVFSQNNEWYVYESGVEYIPISFFENRIKVINFYAFIFVRSIDEYYKIFIENNDCKRIYVQSHDMFIWKDGIYNEKFIYNNQYDRIHKYIALTNFHKEELHKYNNIPYEKIAVIGNGLDSDIFDEIDYYVDIKKDNSILWTSAFGRGGDILVNYIMPIVKKYIPDFKVYICGYGDGVPQDIKDNPDVIFLGTLNKKDYYKEFKKHKVWFLPCVVVEDFGICAGEAIMCDAHIVSPFLHGMKDVCDVLICTKMNHNYNIIETGDYHYGTYQLNMTDEEFNNANYEAANMIIDYIKNYDNKDRETIRKISKDYIMKTHTWKNVVDKWEMLFKEI